MNPAPHRRRHRSRAEKQRLVEAWIASGQSSRAFAEQAELSASNLWRWKRELSAGTTALVPVVVRPEVTAGETCNQTRSPQLLSSVRVRTQKVNEAA
jgi:transposase-like protein